MSQESEDFVNHILRPVACKGKDTKASIVGLVFIATLALLIANGVTLITFYEFAVLDGFLIVAAFVWYSVLTATTKVKTKAKERRSRSLPLIPDASTTAKGRGQGRQRSVVII